MCACLFACDNGKKYVHGICFASLRKGPISPSSVFQRLLFCITNTFPSGLSPSLKKVQVTVTRNKNPKMRINFNNESPQLFKTCYLTI
jgi:hypothetical protein